MTRHPDLRLVQPRDQEECIREPMLCLDVECEHNLTRIMTVRGESWTRCVLHHQGLTPSAIGRVIGLDHKDVQKIIDRATTRLRARWRAMGMTGGFDG